MGVEHKRDDLRGVWRHQPTRGSTGAWARKVARCLLSVGVGEMIDNIFTAIGIYPGAH